MAVGLLYAGIYVDYYADAVSNLGDSVYPRGRRGRITTSEIR